ncbi:MULTISPECIES: MarR family winged helix-turn-helix transcriptional regulator [unclassified Blastococcus]
MARPTDDPLHPDPAADAGEVPARWLEDEEMATWLALVQVLQLLPQALDRQLRQDAGMKHAYYQVLAILSAQPERTLSMGELARQTATSPSRLSHAVAAMEEQGWVSRWPCPTNRRIQYATLTDPGMSLLEKVAPGHVAEVRRLVFDRLTSAEVAQLGSIALRLLTPGTADPRGHGSSSV